MIQFQNALLSTIPFLANWIFAMSYGKILDTLVKKYNFFKITHARKLSMAIASLIPGICLIGVCFSKCDSLPVVIFMIIATCFYGSMFAGVFSNHTDIASNYAGTIIIIFLYCKSRKPGSVIYFSLFSIGLLMGITNMAATIPGFVVPGLVGILTHGVVSLSFQIKLCSMYSTFFHDLISIGWISTMA